MVSKKLIDGLQFTQERRIFHPKGDIIHCIKRSSSGFAGFGEVYISLVMPGEIKGWKCHRSATLNLFVPTGSVRVVVYKEFSESQNSSIFNEFILNDENSMRLTVPPNLWIAFEGIKSKNLLMNVSNLEHDPQETDNIELEKLPFDWKKLPKASSTPVS